MYFLATIKRWLSNKKSSSLFQIPKSLSILESPSSSMFQTFLHQQIKSSQKSLVNGHVINNVLGTRSMHHKKYTMVKLSNQFCVEKRLLLSISEEFYTETPSILCPWVLLRVNYVFLSILNTHWNIVPYISLAQLRWFHTWIVFLHKSWWRVGWWGNPLVARWPDTTTKSNKVDGRCIWKLNKPYTAFTCRVNSVYHS